MADDLGDASRLIDDSILYSLPRSLCQLYIHLHSSAAYSGGLIVSSPVIGWWGEKVQGRQLPLLIGRRHPGLPPLVSDDLPCLALCSMAGALVMFMLSTTFALLLVSRILQGTHVSAKQAKAADCRYCRDQWDGYIHPWLRASRRLRGFGAIGICSW